MLKLRLSKRISKIKIEDKTIGVNVSTIKENVEIPSKTNLRIQVPEIE